MKNQGLKGVTDATQYCKSMNDKNSKNQIIRSMKSYEFGGTTGMMLNNTASEGMCGPGDGGCHRSRRRANNQRLKSAGVSRSNRKRMR
jgi:hypothetical protein